MGVQEIRTLPVNALRVHPAAEVFPMLSDEELGELADDIRANGLHQPIVLDIDGLVIDGRNRLSACNLAGVEPRFEEYDGDPIAYIWGANVHRRHMNKGQEAAALVVLACFSETSLHALEKTTGVDHTRIAYARTVQQWAPEKLDGVIKGIEALNDAYSEARRRKTAAESAEAQLALLEKSAPDLAEMVRGEQLTLSEALATLEQRRKDDQRKREGTTRLVLQTLQFLDPGAMTAEELAHDIATHMDPGTANGPVDFSRGRLLLASETLRRVADLYDGRK